jgi:orotate phosphoribosyltransferase
MTELVDLVEQTGAVRRGKFKLSDGALTDYYVDKYEFETDPEVLSVVADHLAQHIDTDAIDVVAGPAMGAVPLVTAVSLATGVDAAFVRGGEQHTGAMARVEGNVDLGDRVVVLEDVTNTGRTVLETANLLEELGASVELVVTVVDRNEGAAERISDAGFEFVSLLRVGEDITIE